MVRYRSYERLQVHSEFEERELKSRVWLLALWNLLPYTTISIQKGGTPRGQLLEYSTNESTTFCFNFPAANTRSKGPDVRVPFRSRRQQLVATHKVLYLTAVSATQRILGTTESSCRAFSSDLLSQHQSRLALLMHCLCFESTETGPRAERKRLSSTIFLSPPRSRFTIAPSPTHTRGSNSRFPSSAWSPRFLPESLPATQLSFLERERGYGSEDRLQSKPFLVS